MGALDGQRHHRRYIRQCRGSGDPGRYPQVLAVVKHLFADGAYGRLKLMDKAVCLSTSWSTSSVDPTTRRLPDTAPPLGRRAGGWMTRWGGLVCDYEQRIDVSQAMILVAIGGNSPANFEADSKA